MFGFIKNILNRRKEKQRKLDELVERIVEVLEETGEDTIVIPTEYFVQVNLKLRTEYDLAMNYIQGDEEKCLVKVCDYVNTRVGCDI